MPRTARRQEIDAVAASGAGVVICPSTEGNLGDGLADLPGWLQAGVPLAIGSDSHVTRAWPEELRWLEYGQRLLHRQRNVAAAPAQGQPATAARLFERALGAGGTAAGFKSWGLQVGARADLLVIDTQDAALLGIPAERLLDALVFSSPGQPFRDVLVAGRWGLGAARRHAAELVVVLLDVDHFKQVNDRHGHAVGDLALQHVAALLVAQSRAGEPLLRFGGEEFLALLAASEPGGAEQAVERMLQALRGTPLRLDDGSALGLRASAGLAVVGPDETLDSALARADRALYAAKAAGRDCWRWAA
jgi:diguanylate cyclase (GGDEF)-like protein